MTGLTGALLVLGLVVLGPSSPAGAHPLGNFTTNTSVALRIRPDEVLVDYVVDLAEIPALQARPGIDADGDDELSAAEQQSYAETTCTDATTGLTLDVDGRPVALTSSDPDISLPPGQAGLNTLRVECQLTAPATLASDPTTVHLVDTNYPDTQGWREIVAQGDRTTVVDADVEAESTTERLTSYPSGRSGSPTRQLEATVRVVPGGPAAPDPDADGGSGVLPSVDRLTDLVGERTLTIPFAIFALGLSFVLGGFHALAPGHGKTVIAAYLVGAEGTRRQAFLLGLTVAVTHTGGVFALALVVSNSSVAPERLYPLLGSLSGLLVLAIGVVLLRRAVQFRRLFPTLGPGASTHHHHGLGGHTHSHDNDGNHDHDGHDHESHCADHDHDRAQGADGHGHTDADHSHDDHSLSHDHGPTPDHVHDDHSHGTAAVDETSAPATTVGDPGPTAPTDPEQAPEQADAPEIAPRMRLRNMMAMGFAGGMVPSPSALVVLLGSIAIGRAWFGLLLIVAYGAGLAAVLVGAGLVIERLRHRIEPLLSRRSRPRLAALAVNLPIITSVLVVLGGAYLVARAVTGA